MIVCGDLVCMTRSFLATSSHTSSVHFEHLSVGPVLFQALRQISSPTDAQFHCGHISSVFCSSKNSLDGAGEQVDVVLVVFSSLSFLFKLPPSRYSRKPTELDTTS